MDQEILLLETEEELEILKAEFDEFQEESQEYEKALEQEVAQKDEALQKINCKLEDVQDAKRELMGKYTLNEREIATLQNKIEVVTRQKESVRKQMRELENENDSWENQSRIMEQTKDDLEERLSTAEEKWILYKEELNEIQENSSIEIQRLRDEVSEINSEIQATKQKQSKPPKLPKPRIEPLKPTPTRALSVLAHLVGPDNKDRGFSDAEAIGIDEVIEYNMDVSEVYVKLNIGRVILGKSNFIIVQGSSDTNKISNFWDLLNHTLQSLASQLKDDDHSLSVLGLKITGDRMTNLISHTQNFSSVDEALETGQFHLGVDWDLDQLMTIFGFSENQMKMKNAQAAHFLIQLRISEWINLTFWLLSDIDSVGLQTSSQRADIKTVLANNRSINMVQDMLIARKRKLKIDTKTSPLCEIINTLLDSNCVLNILLYIWPKNAEQSMSTLEYAIKIRNATADKKKKSEKVGDDLRRVRDQLSREIEQKKRDLLKTERLVHELCVYGAFEKAKDDKITNLGSVVNTREKEVQDEIARIRKENQELQKNYEATRKELATAKSQKAIQIISTPPKINKTRQNSKLVTSPPQSPLEAPPPRSIKRSGTHSVNLAKVQKRVTFV